MPIPSKSEKEKREIVEKYIALKNEQPHLTLVERVHQVGASRDSIFKWAIQFGYGDLRMGARIKKPMAAQKNMSVTAVDPQPISKKPELISIPLKAKPESKGIGVAVAGDEAFLANFTKQLLGE